MNDYPAHANAEINEVAAAADSAVRSTMLAAHSSGRHAPDAPGKPARWRGETAEHHAMRSAAHLLEFIVRRVKMPEEFAEAFGQTVATLIYLTNPDSRTKGGLKAASNRLEADEAAGLSIPHALTRLAMAKAVSK